MKAIRGAAGHVDWREGASRLTGRVCLKKMTVSQDIAAEAQVGMMGWR